MADEIAESSPTSIRLSMDMLSEMADEGDANKAAFSLPNVLDELLVSEDFFEGLKAFSQKCKPVWKGK